MSTRAPAPAAGVLAEDRLLWEFWLNHGLEPAPLRERIAELPAGANGWYMAGNALYGGFERALHRALEGAGGGEILEPVRAVLRSVAGDPARQVTFRVAEGKLLALLALWPAEGSQESARAERLAAQVGSWNSFFRAAGRSNLLPAAAAGLRFPGVGARVPVAVRAAVESAAEGIASRNARLLPLIEEMAAAFTRKGIRHCLLKESALLLEIYPGPAERLVGDVDILTSQDDLAGVEEVLRAAGHRPFEGIWSKGWYLSHHHHAAPLVSAEAATKFEPHTGIWIPGGASVDLAGEILDTSRPHKRFPSLRPDPTIMAFHLLCDFHGGAGVGKLGQVADLMRFLSVEGAEVERGRLEDLAARTNARDYVEDSIDLVETIFGRELVRARAPALSIGRRDRTKAGDRLRQRLERRFACGFEPGGNALSLASVKQLHRSLMLPAGDAARATAFVRAIVLGSKSREGAGDIARKGRGSVANRILRLATFPFRAAARSLRARRGS